jgi:hypothetical protein
MEVVYFYEDKDKKAVDNLLQEEFFKRLGPSTHEARLTGTKRKAGYYLHIKAESSDKMKEALRLIEESKLPLVKVTGDEEKEVIDAIHKEEEEAASGMGAIFG